MIEPTNPLKSDPKAVKEFHVNDDVDSSTKAHHHTLGDGLMQAARGSTTKKALDDLAAYDALVEGRLDAFDVSIDDLEAYDLLVDGRLDALEAVAPYAIGHHTVTAGSFTSGTDHAILTPDSQTLRAGITYNSGTGAYTVPIAGVYRLTFQTAWANNATAWRRVTVTITGGRTYSNVVQAANGLASTPCLSIDLVLAANDVLTPVSRQQSGGNLALDLTAGLTFFSIAYVRP